jgi:hypothetical protein
MSAVFIEKIRSLGEIRNLGKIKSQMAKVKWQKYEEGKDGACRLLYFAFPLVVATAFESMARS